MTNQYKIEILVNTSNAVDMTTVIKEVEKILKSHLGNYISVDTEKVKVIKAEYLLKFDVQSSRSDIECLTSR